MLVFMKYVKLFACRWLYFSHQSQTSSQITSFQMWFLCFKQFYCFKIYDCEKDDGIENGKDDKEERFNCDFEGCKYSYISKKSFLLHFKTHFTDSTCKKCGKTLAQTNQQV